MGEATTSARRLPGGAGFGFGAGLVAFRRDPLAFLL